MPESRMRHGFYDGMMTGASAAGRWILKHIWRITREDALECHSKAFSAITEGFAGKPLEIPVTVRTKEFSVRRVETSLKGIPNAVVLLSYPRDAVGVASALRVFLSTDTSLSAMTIPDFYTKRWGIEVFFRQVKQKLALNKCQIPSAVGIQRFWILMSLAYLLCCLESERMSFTDGYALFRKAIKTERARPTPRGNGCLLGA